MVVEKSTFPAHKIGYTDWDYKAIFQDYTQIIWETAKETWTKGFNHVEDCRDT